MLEVLFGNMMIQKKEGDGYMEKSTSEFPFKHKKKTVSRYDSNGHYVDSFESLNQAQRKLGIPASSISLCVNNKTKTAGGYIWKFGSNKEPLKPEEYTKLGRKDGLFQQRPVNQYTKTGKFIKQYVSVLDASRQIGVNPDLISQNARNKSLTAGGYLWRYGEIQEQIVVDLTRKPRSGNTPGKPISQFTLDGQFVKTYPSLKQADKETGVDKSNISMHLRGKSKKAGGYIWQRGVDTELTDENKVLIRQNPSGKKTNRYIKKKKKKLHQYDKSGKYINSYESLVVAEKETGVSRRGISKNLTGIIQSTGGFVWQYGEKQYFIDPIKYNTNVKPKPIDQYNSHGELIASYPSVHSAAIATNQDRARIRLNALGKIKSAGNFIWQYQNPDQDKN